MQTFEFKNDLEGNRSSYKFNRRVVKFGDGYEQRVSHGINSKSGEWNYQRTAKFEEVERIADFFDQHYCVVPFSYRNPEGKNVKAIAEDYQITHLGGGISRISTTFKQVF